MRSIGSDIQIVNLPRGKVSEILRNFARSAGLVINQEIEDRPKTNITVSNNITSYFKFWWAGIPQIIEWQLTKLNDHETAVETRFGFQKKFYFWFWSIVVSMVILSAIFYFVGKSQPLSHNPNELIKSINTALIAFLFVGLSIIVIFVFLVKSIYITYDDFIDLVKAELEKSDISIKQTRVRSNPAPPHMYDVLIFVLSAAIAIAFIFGGSFLERTPGTKLTLLLLVVTIIVILLIAALYCVKIEYFPQRLMFAAAGIFFTIQLIIFYSVPFFNLYSEDIIVLFNRTKSIEVNHENRWGDIFLEQELLLFYETVKPFFILAVSLNTLIIVLALTLFAFTPFLIRAIRRWRVEFFSGNEWILFRRPAADFSTYVKSFSFVIFSLWIVCSGVLYLLIYTAFGAAEFCLLDKNVIFTSEVVQQFCMGTYAIFGYFLSSITGIAASVTIAKFWIIIYFLPLFWAIYKVVVKRIKNYNGIMRDVKKYLVNRGDDYIALNRLCKKIAEDLEIPVPKLAIIPNHFPFLFAKYVGVPYFRSFIFVSKGCLNLKESELAGLLAHEMYHVKNHTLKWYALNLLSDITLFGTGFLAVTTNTYNYELEADQYAASWVNRNGDVSDYINALRVTSSFPINLAGSHLNASPPKTGDTRDNDKEKSVFKKIKRKIDVIFEFYFGDEILSYIHPPIEYRIEKIIGFGNDLTYQSQPAYTRFSDSN